MDSPEDRIERMEEHIFNEEVLYEALGKDRARTVLHIWKRHKALLGLDADAALKLAEDRLDDIRSALYEEDTENFRTRSRIQSLAEAIAALRGLAMEAERDAPEAVQRIGEEDSSQENVDVPLPRLHAKCPDCKKRVRIEEDGTLAPHQDAETEPAAPGETGSPGATPAASTTPTCTGTSGTPTPATCRRSRSTWRNSPPVSPHPTNHVLRHVRRGTDPRRLLPFHGGSP